LSRPVACFFFITFFIYEEKKQEYINKYKTMQNSLEKTQYTELYVNTYIIYWYRIFYHDLSHDYHTDLIQSLT